MSGFSGYSRALLGGVLLSVASLAGCVGEEGGDLRTPSAAEIRPYYEFSGSLDVEMSGNVAQVTVTIDREAYLQGGSLWVRASPYIFLFSPATQEALTDHPGLGGVRVVVRYADGTMVAQALLDRANFRPGLWPRAIQTAARARTEGTESPGYMRDLVRWGEDHTEFEYNPDYVPDAR